MEPRAASPCKCGQQHICSVTRHACPGSDSLCLLLLQIRSTPEASTDASRRLLTEGGMMDPTFVPRYSSAPEHLACSALPAQRCSRPERAALLGVYTRQACKAMWQGASGTLCLDSATSPLLGRHSLQCLCMFGGAAG